MMSLASLSSLRIPFRALLELPAILGPGDDQRKVERQHPLLGQEDRHPALDDAQGETLHDRGLADTGLAQQDRVVLGPPREDLDDPFDLALAADQRVEGALRGECREITAVLGEEGQLLLLQRGLALLGERKNLLAQGVDVEALLTEDARRDRSLRRAEFPPGGAPNPTAVCSIDSASWAA
jgi:hypothetical protein